MNDENISASRSAHLPNLEIDNSPRQTGVGDEPSPSDADRRFRQARIPMIVVIVFMVVVVLISAGCFAYQLFYRLPNGAYYVGTAEGWRRVLGHFIRALGLTAALWRLSQCVFAIDRYTGRVTDSFALRFRQFWTTLATAGVAMLLMILLQWPYLTQDQRTQISDLFRPEYQSDYVLLNRMNFELRCADIAPREGYSKMKKEHSEEVLFVCDEPEITGKDIERAALQIAEVFPGQQVVNVHIVFTADGAKKMEELTKRQYGKPLACLYDGTLRAAPRVFGVISGDARLSNVFTMEEAERRLGIERPRGIVTRFD